MLDIDHRQRVEEKAQIKASEITSVLDDYGEGITVLSLDCFDTLLWRMTATPADVFHAMQHQPVFQACHATAYQRIAAAARAYRAKAITQQSRQVTLDEIYAEFAGLSADQKASLADCELQMEAKLCYAFQPFVALIRAAVLRNIRVVIVSDTYFNQAQLKYLLSCHLPMDVMNGIQQIFCSVDYGVGKSDGLFQHVARQVGELTKHILHIGDHQIADFEAPKKMGIKALHFVQFDQQTNAFLQMQQTAASVSILSRPEINYVKEARYSPYRGMLSLQNSIEKTPANLIGYLSFGPMLYAFAQFIADELQELAQSGKKIKPLFLLRDAYLLYKSCEVYAGKPMGELARIRKFLAVAASFRSQEDIDYYLSSIKPAHFNTYVICEQLLIPHDHILQIQQVATQAQNQQEKFYQILHDPAVMSFVFKRSAEVRERLKKYLVNELNIEAGDTIVLIDTGYHGVTQDFLTRAIGDEMNVKIIGRYFIASHEPDRPDCRSLLTSTWCEHGLFEQCCTYQEGAVSGYSEEGKPIFEPIKLTDNQYHKVRAVQAQALKFVHDAKKYFAESKLQPPFEYLVKYAETSLIRQVFLPLPDEVHYFSDFQHDKDMGPKRDKKMFDVTQAQVTKRQSVMPFKAHPFEDRALNLEASLSALMQRAFNLTITQSEKSYSREMLNALILRDGQYTQVKLEASPTHDGYFATLINVPANCHVGIVFGAAYEWVQIDAIKLFNQQIDLLAKGLFTQHQMKQDKSIFKCESSDAYLMLPALNQSAQLITYQLVFRPISRRELHLNQTEQKG